INFGRTNFVVKPGSPFLRISFHRCPISPKADKSAKYEREQYISRTKEEVAAYLAPTFLNMEATADAAAPKAFESFKNGLFIWATVATVIVALLAIFAPLGASNVEKLLQSRAEHQIQLQETIEKKVEERYESRLKTLSDEIDELKRTAENRSNKANVSKE